MSKFPKLSERPGVCFDFYSTDTRPTDYPLHELSPKIWFYDYSYSPHTHKPSGSASSTLYPLNYPNQYQMAYNVKTTGTATAGSVANAYPGRKWLIGNEPDVASQSNNTPEQYALGYKNLYNAIKSSDPTSLIYMGGVGSMSEARMVWMGSVVDYYYNSYGSALPCDGIHAHGYIVEESPSPSPGINQPVGLPGTLAYRGGTAYGYHTDANVFAEDVTRMRQWMYDRGYQNKPLIISEYGCLLPAEGWLKTPEVQGTFLQDTFDFMLYGKDEVYGCPLDDYKLVQEFALFSANYSGFPDGRLFDNDKQLTELGEYYRRYWFSNFFDVNLTKEDNSDIYDENGSLLQFNVNHFGEI